MIITTTDTVPGRQVKGYVGLVKGCSVRGNHAADDLVAGIKNKLGGEIQEYTKMFAEVREQAIDRMIEDARALAAGPTPVLAGLSPGPNGSGTPAAGEYYFHRDHVFSTSVVTNSAGQEVTRLVYKPYGAIYQDASTGTDLSRSKFTQKELDEQSQLYYFGDRYYDPAVGRFLSPDPDSQYNSPYVYGDNRPEDNIDPDGDSFFLIAMIIVGALIGAYSGGAAVNHDYNPAHWDWSSGKTWAGITGGAVLGAAGGWAGAEIAEAGLGIAGTLAAEGVLGGVENTAFAAMAGADTAGELGRAFLQGFAVGVVFGGATRVLGAAVRRASRLVAARRLNAGVEEAADSTSPTCKKCRCSSFVAGTAIATVGDVSGVALTSAAFESGISWFPYVLAVAVVLFAFSTMISWSYYGLKAWTYLFGEGKASELTFKIIFCVFVVIGAAASLGPVIDFSDAAIFAMAVVNIFALYFLMKVVRKELESYSARIKSGEIKKFSHC